MNRDPRVTGRFTQTSHGMYQVHFGRDIGDCVPVASFSNGVLGDDIGFVTVGIESTFQVSVLTYDADGTRADAPFDLILAC